MPSLLHQVSFSLIPRILNFKFEAGTSRGVLKKKRIYFLKAIDPSQPQIEGWGEAAPLPGLSEDDLPDFEEILDKYCKSLFESHIPGEQNGIENWVENQIPSRFPSIRFAFETALLDLAQGGNRKLFDNSFFDEGQSILINGLIWMGDKATMLKQVDQKLADGNRCIKLKIGALDFGQECEVLAYIRSKYSKSDLILRVDANGAFSPGEALEKLEMLSQYDLHSIEQPIRQGQRKEMAALCKKSPIPIALDEELIGVYDEDSRKELLKDINPQYIILKPTLVGGMAACKSWISLAEEMKVGWWMTSALESNVGLNAIAQFTATFQSNLHQGLGTGQLFDNNIDSPLMIKGEQLHYDKNQEWSRV